MRIARIVWCVQRLSSWLGIVSKGVTPHKKNIRKTLKHGADVEDSHDWPCNMPIHWNVTNPSKKELPPTPPFAFSLLRISVFTSSIYFLNLIIFLSISFLFSILITIDRSQYVSVLLSIWQSNKLFGLKATSLNIRCSSWRPEIPTHF